MRKKEAVVVKVSEATWTDVIHDMKAVSSWLTCLHRLMAAQPQQKILGGDKIFDPGGTVDRFFYTCLHTVPLKGNAVRIEDLTRVLKVLRGVNNDLIKKVTRLSGMR